MTRQYSVIIERDKEGYYVASVPALKGCHSQAKSLDELMDRIKEAIELCLEVLCTVVPVHSGNLKDCELSHKDLQELM